MDVPTINPWSKSSHSMTVCTTLLTMGFQCLPQNKLVVDSTGFHQLWMFSWFHNSPILHHHNSVHSLNCGHSVCYDDRGPAGGGLNTTIYFALPLSAEHFLQYRTLSSYLIQCIFYDFFAISIQRRRGFIQKKNLWIPNKGTSNSYSLFLTSR